MELDQVFIRALRLLHSKSKDSVHQLKALLDESIRTKGNFPAAAAASSSSSSAPCRPTAATSLTPKESEKRNFEKLKRDLSELANDGGGGPGAKVPRLHHSPQRFAKSHSPSPTPTPTPPTGVAVSGELISGGNSSAEEVDLDMNLEGLNDLSCCICKNWNQGSGNKLMECHTCQNLYHQECHAPPISNDEASDPRLVWNCSQCKSVTAVTPAPVTVRFAGGGPSASSKLTSSRSGSSGSQQQSGIFKRSEPAKQPLGGSFKSSSSSSKGSSGGGNFGSHKTSMLTSSSGSSSSNAIMGADKRLQMMKKKAAAQRKK